MKALHFGAVFCSCISLLCLLVALATDYWLGGSSIHVGLWKICNPSLCQSYGVEWLSASFHAIRTFMFLGMIAGVISLGGLCIMNREPRIAYIASFTAGLCVMIAMSIFTGESGNTNYYLWSFGLGWASFPLYLLTGCLSYVLYVKTATTA